ncbi:hypothetical protein [Amycolatopsis taiwanensis]|uniref:Uncharacterized protein n=1 Tax=Amycolatopsis taiwanensis TaxID=342230 RepID=A0A9W6QV69_9PSEU|nr:hypothetical protein [Amycolatopsis taiwanensis]GLY64169.1 hypothetical protein Atai01_07880 [Amycolatopsis taiwanensis]
MAPPDESGIVNNADGLIDMYPDAAERVFQALGQIHQTFTEGLPSIRQVLEQEMTLGNGKAGESFLNSYKPSATDTFRYVQQRLRMLSQDAQDGHVQVTRYRAVDAQNAAALRRSQQD